MTSFSGNIDLLLLALSTYYPEMSNILHLLTFQTPILLVV